MTEYIGDLYWPEIPLWMLRADNKRAHEILRLHLVTIKDDADPIPSWLNVWANEWRQQFLPFDKA